MQYRIIVQSSANHMLGWMSKTGYIQRLGYEVGLEPRKYIFDDGDEDDDADYIVACEGFRRRYPGLINNVLFVQKPLEEEEDDHD